MFARSKIPDQVANIRLVINAAGNTNNIKFSSFAGRRHIGKAINHKGMKVLA
jgi:hypothetical protein